MIVKIKFRGIDNWNRPVYKDIDSPNHYGNVLKLFSYDDSKERVDNYHKDHLDELCYFGQHFGCEPMGGLNKEIIFKLII